MDEDVPRTTMEEIASGIFWVYDGDENRWPALIRGLNAAELRLLSRTADSVYRHTAAAFALMNGLTEMLQVEQQSRDAQQAGEPTP